MNQVVHLVDAVNAALRRVETFALNAAVSESHDQFAKNDRTGHRAPVAVIDKNEVLVPIAIVLTELHARIVLNSQIDNRVRKIRRIQLARKVQIVQSNQIVQLDQIERKDQIEPTEPKDHHVPKVLKEAKDRPARKDPTETSGQ